MGNILPPFVDLVTFSTFGVFDVESACLERTLLIQTEICQESRVFALKVANFLFQRAHLQPQTFLLFKMFQSVQMSG